MKIDIRDNAVRSVHEINFQRLDLSVYKFTLYSRVYISPKLHRIILHLGNIDIYDILLRERDSPNVIPVWIGFSAEAHGTVAVEELLKERAAREPHPHAGVYRPVGVQQQLVEHL